MRSEAHRVHHRGARIHPPPLERGELRIAPPPDPLPARSSSVAQTALPALGSLGMVGMAVLLGDGRYVAMAGVMAVAMVGAAVATRRLQARASVRDHAERVARYRAHLRERESALTEAARRQRHHDAVTSPPPADLWSVLVDGRRVWERRVEDGDFLTVRLGSGPAAAAIRPVLDAPTDPTASRDAALTAAAEDLVDRHATVPGSAVRLDLTGCVALAGDLHAARTLARSLVLQLVTFCGPDRLRLVVSHPSEAEADWEWVTELPHCRLDGEVLAGAEPEQLAHALERLIRPRLSPAADRDGRRAPTPHVVVVMDGYRPDEARAQVDLLEEATAEATHLSMTVLYVAGSPSSTPPNAHTTIAVAAGSITAMPADPGVPRIQAVPEPVPLGMCESAAGLLGQLVIRRRAAGTASVESPSVCDLLGLADPRHLPEIGPERPGMGELRVPIGITDSGEPLVLDLEESAVGGMGPHGLLVGATGSGKSELLRAIVTGLAARSTPEDVAFVLVDFKGGATFSRAGALPHSAGLVTNLEGDPALVERTREALQGEMERRQRLLRDAGRLESADAYRAHRARHPELELPALPSLVVVVDEFGELLTAHPEFVDLLTAVGRLGRSLGMHLLMSTQRMEEGRTRALESHLRYRLCLRTFTPEESSRVLGSPQAADLPPLPGSAYLKVDGSLMRFKAAWTGRQVDGLAEFDHLLDAIRATWRGAPAARVWPDPLPASRSLQDLLGTPAQPGDPRWLRPPIGWTDDPRNQRTDQLDLDLSGAGGHVAVVGGPRSGKSTTLQTLVLSIAAHHNPSDLQIYAIDLGGGGLAALDGLPHLGAAIGPGQPDELVALVRLVVSRMDERAAAFRRHRVTDMRAYHALRREGAVVDEHGEIVLVVDGWAALARSLPAAVFDDFSDVLVRGLDHGIHVVLSAGRWQDLRTQVRDAVGGRLELRLADPLDSEIDRTRARLVPVGVPGRGLAPNGRLAQVALPAADGVVGHGELVQSIAHRFAGHQPAPPVLTLPLLVEPSGLPPARGEGVVVGLEEHHLGGWEVDLFGADQHLLVLGDAESGKTNLLSVLTDRLTDRFDPAALQVAIIDYRRRLHGRIPPGHLFSSASGSTAAAELARRLADEVAARRAALLQSPDTVPGPRIVLAVDDYDLVAGSAVSPLAGLAGALAEGRDLGIHAVVARRVGGLARASFEPFLQTLRELGTPVAVMSGDPSEGPVTGSVRPAFRPAGRAVWVSRGRVTEVHAAYDPGADGTVRRLERRAG